MATNPNILTDIDSEYQQGVSYSELVKGVDAVRNMILNLFKTNSQAGDSLGDRPYENSYGCNIERYLFSPLDEITALNIKDCIYNAVTSFLPDLFVSQNSIMVIPNYNSDSYLVVVAYVYRGEPSSLDFNLPRKA